MIIKKIYPIGYCNGVCKALTEIRKLKKSSNKKIYLLGNLVHNEYTMQKLLRNNITIFDVFPKDYKKIIENFKDENGIVILSAHGHNVNINNLLTGKNIEYKDTTCDIVLENYNKIINILNGSKNNIIFFICKKNHPESSIFENIENVYCLDIDEKTYPKQLNDKQIYIFCQTTLNRKMYLDFATEIKNHFKNSKIIDSTCKYLNLREEKIYNLDDSYTKILVIGSNTSSNSKTLFELAKHYKKNMEVLFINNGEQISKDMFSNNDKIAVFSGTSTSIEEIDIIIDKIKSFF